LGAFISAGLTALVYVGIGWFASRVTAQESWSVLPTALLWPSVPLGVGIVLAASRRTRRTGAGILLGLAIGLLVSGGLCQYMNSVGITGSR